MFRFTWKLYDIMLIQCLYITVPGFTAGKTISTCVYVIWEILANMTHVSDVAPMPLYDRILCIVFKFYMKIKEVGHVPSYSQFTVCSPTVSKCMKCLLLLKNKISIKISFSQCLFQVLKDIQNVRILWVNTYWLLALCAHGHSKD